MSVLYVVLPIALIIAAVAVAAFVWAVRSGQMDDLETPALRILHDDETAGADGRRGGADRTDPDRDPTQTSPE